MSDFNQAAADSVYQIISKMDDDEALMFSRMVVHDLLYADLDNNRRTITSFTNEILQGIQEDVSKALSGRGESAEPIRALVETISKNGQWNEENWVRDKGRFSRYRGPNTKRPTGKTKLKTELQYNRADPSQRRVVVRDSRTGSQFDVTSALGYQQRDKAADMATEFAERWTREGARGTNEQTYRRIQEGSKLMAQVGGATGSTSLVLAGQVGQMAGSMGPSAEQVLGPSMRKAAYRYRGTERPVDAQLQRESSRRISSHLAHEKIAPERLTPEDRTELSRISAMSYLQQRLPNKKLTELQRQSGKLPPSEGVIINGDGKIITQAVGYQEDHYLPFNLKNLKGLQGGSYVRTRSSGGLTSEDIYTGLMSGARSVTVVSRSGVFTLDFEDDFRGERRYSDKARQMVGRYEQILNTVQSETVSRRALEPEEKIAIRDQVEEELSYLSHTWEGRQQMEQTIKEREKAFSTATHLTSEELKAINELAKEAAKNPNMRTSSAVGRGDRAVGGVGGRPTRTPNSEEDRYKMVRAELISNAMDAKAAKHYRLDGEGYEVALNALAEQYPYYIQGLRVQTRNEDIPISRETDKGYVSPGANRPNAVQAGFFGVNTGKGGSTEGKFSASELNYQRPKDRAGRTTAREPEKQGTAAQTSGANASKLKRPQSVQERRRTIDNQLKADEALAAFGTSAAGILTTEQLSSYPALKRLRDIDGSEDEQNQKVQSLLKNTVSRQEILREAKQVHTLLSGSKEPQNVAAAANMADKLSTYESRQRQASNKVFDAETYREVPDAPFKFDDVVPGRPQDEYAQQFSQLSGGTGPQGAKDEDLKKLAKTLKVQADAFESAVNDPNFNSDDAMRTMRSIGMDENAVDTVVQELDNIYESGNSQIAQSRVAQLRQKGMALEKARAVLQEYNAAGEQIGEKTRAALSPTSGPKPADNKMAEKAKLSDLSTLHREIARQVDAGETDEQDLVAIGEMENYARNVANGESRIDGPNGVRDDFRMSWNDLSSLNQRRAAAFLGRSIWDDLGNDDDDS